MTCRGARCRGATFGAVTFPPCLTRSFRASATWSAAGWRGPRPVVKKTLELMKIADLFSVVVTPEKNLFMDGYASRNKPAEGKVQADIELQPLSAINDVLERLEHGKVASRVVIDFMSA